MYLKETTEILQAQLYRDGSFTNLGFSIHDGPGLLTWIEKRKFLHGILANKGITAVVAPTELAALLPNHLGVIIHEQPRDAFYALHNHLARETSFYGTERNSDIHPSAKISPHARIDETGVVIGPNSIIEAGVTVFSGTQIGCGCIIRAGTVLGSQGFQFTKMGGRWVGVDHVGGVLIGDDVEIQANANVCRSIFGGNTEVGENSKIDAFVHVAHNVRIGKRVLLCAGTVIGGSTIIGDDVYMGPGVTVLNCIRIGEKARITMGSVVVRTMGSGKHVSGNWALPHDKFLRAYGRFIDSDDKESAR